MTDSLRFLLVDLDEFLRQLTDGTRQLPHYLESTPRNLSDRIDAEFEHPDGESSRSTRGLMTL